MKQKNKLKIHPRKLRLLTIFFAVFTFFLSSEIIAQEKVAFLQHRYDGTLEIITKDFTKEKLNIVKNRLAREGIIFSFYNLKYNKKNEIVKITIHIKNKKSNSSATWNDNKKPIPDIKTGETLGFVFATTYINKLFKQQ